MIINRTVSPYYERYISNTMNTVISKRSETSTTYHTFSNIWTCSLTCLSMCLKIRVAAVERLRVFHQSADYIFISFGIIEPIVASLKRSSAHVNASGRKQFCKLHYCFWRVSKNPKLPFSICNMFFVSKGNLLKFYCQTMYNQIRRRVPRLLIWVYNVCGSIDNICWNNYSVCWDIYNVCWGIS